MTIREHGWVSGRAPAILDAARYALEKASRGRNTIFYNGGGEEIHAVRLDAYSYADLGAAYTAGMNGTGILEAFLVNSTQKTHLWIGKYPAARSASGRVVCQPGLAPWTNINWDEAVAACAGLGAVSGYTPRLMSTWDWAAVTHEIMASGRGQPNGNTNFGQHHTATWQRAPRLDGALPGVTTGSHATLCGAGPREWNHDLGEFGIADLVGNVWEWQSGFSITNGVVSLAPDNGTATTEASWGVQSGFVLPASATWSGMSNAGASYALKRALIVPADGVASPSGVLAAALASVCFPLRGGYSSAGVIAGLAALAMDNSRTARHPVVGFRPVFVPSSG